MKTPTLKGFLLRVLPLLLVVFSGWYVYSEESGVTETYKAATAPFNEKSIDSMLTLPGGTIRVMSAEPRQVFWTETRKDKMERFQCTQCHNDQNVKVAMAAEIAHGDILLDHGGLEKPLSCFTCHKEDERDFLETETGIKIDMDRSYELCGQCHFRQKKDWAGGAHGKRVSNWAGKRIVQNCVSCHDPHSPHFKKRWPVTYSQPVKK